MWVPLNSGAAEGFDVEALLERSERGGALSGSESVEVRARVVVLIVCNGRHF